MFDFDILRVNLSYLEESFGILWKPWSEKKKENPVHGWAEKNK